MARSQDATPIARIPDDTLHDIFYLVVASSARPGRDMHPFHYRFPSVYALMLSHVCRYWRVLSLASPQLWSFLYINAFTSLSMVREFLKRSGTSPLSVCFEGPESYWVSTEDLLGNARVISSHTDRLANFRTIDLLEGDLQHLLAFFPSPAPQLQALDLRVPSPYRSLEFPAPFASTLPLLRSVCVCGLSLQWLPYTNLTSLVLTAQPAPSLTALVRTLKESPDLEVLSLSLRDDMTTDTDSSPSFATISLPRLRKLSLAWKDNRHALLHVLGCISFPPSTIIELKFFGVFHVPLDLTLHCPSLRARVAAIRSGKIWINDDSKPVFIGVSSMDGQFAVEWDWPRVPGEPVTGLEHVGLAAVPLPALESVVLRDTDWGERFRDEQWLSILRQIPPSVAVTVQITRVNDQLAHDLLEMLRRGPAADTGAQVLCPGLEHLDLEVSWYFPVDVMKDMISTFKYRAERGSRLTSLRIRPSPSTPHFKHSVLLELRSVVGNVDIVDGNR